MPTACWYLVVACLLAAGGADGALLAASKVEQCVDAGDAELQCEKKMVITLTVTNNQNGTERFETLIRESVDSNGEVVRLQQPLVRTRTSRGCRTTLPGPFSPFPRPFLPSFLPAAYRARATLLAFSCERLLADTCSTAVLSLFCVKDHLCAQGRVGGAVPHHVPAVLQQQAQGGGDFRRSLFDSPV